MVLIGAETANRPWVKYEIEQSIARKNGLLGIYIHRLKDLNKRSYRSRSSNRRYQKAWIFPLTTGIRIWIIFGKR